MASFPVIDFKEKTLCIRHTVCKTVLDGQQIVVQKDTTKNKASIRTLPLIPEIEELLLETKKKQETQRKKAKGSYCKDYLDYVCVDSLGELLKPDYLTQHFEIIIKKKQSKAHSISRFATLLRFAITCQWCIFKRNSRLVRPFGFQYNGKYL